MTRTEERPQYRKYERYGRAVVTIDRQEFDLGKFESAASRSKYDQIVTEWIANGRVLPSAAQQDRKVTVATLVSAYRRFAKDYYRGSTEVENFELSVKPLLALYSRLLATEFGPIKLRPFARR